MEELAVVSRKRPSRAQQVIWAACESYELDERVLLAHTRTCGCHGKSSCRCGCSPRSRAYNEARMVIVYVLHEEMAMACMRIGWLLQRDHSTINYHVLRMREQLPVRSDLRWRLEQLRAALRNKGVLLR